MRNAIGIPEHYKFVLDAFPGLGSYTQAEKNDDIIRVSRWLGENTGILKKIGEKNLQNPEFVEWGKFHCWKGCKYTFFLLKSQIKLQMKNHKLVCGAEYHLKSVWRVFVYFFESIYLFFYDSLK